jgi:hypothetical protein
MSEPNKEQPAPTPKPKDDTDYKSRVIKEVPAPYSCFSSINSSRVWNYIPRDQLFDKDGLPIIDNLRKHLLKEGRVDPKDGIEIIQKAANILRDEPNLLQLQDPITGIFLFSY